MRRSLRAFLLVAMGASVAGAMLAPPGDVIRVRGVSGDTVLALLPSPGGGLVRIDELARLLGGSLDSAGAGRWRLGLYGVTLDLVEGTPFASYQGVPIPLSDDTRVIGGAPHGSLQLFSEIVPRFGVGILWDRERAEVRLFQAIARRAVPAGSSRDAPTPVRAAAATTASAPPPAADRRSAPNEPPAAPTTITPTAVHTTPAPLAAARGLSRRYLVAVDAGHGGADPGNPGVIIDGRQVNEAKLTLAIALKVEEALHARGVGVLMTRRGDTLVARDDRGPIANQAKADLFISIHTNAANPAWRNGASVRGFETYYLSEARTEDERRVAAMENEVVRFEANVEAQKGDPLSFILNDLAQNEHLRESYDLASVVQQMLTRSHPGPNRGVKQAGFAVLARAYMPAVLVEVGFGSNAAEARWMASAVGQRAIAESIADATVEYLVHYERRTGVAPR